MSDELLTIDAAVDSIVSSYAYIEEHIASERDGEIIRHIANRIVSRLQPIMSRAGLGYESVTCGSGHGPVQGLKAKSLDLSPF